MRRCVVFIFLGLFLLSHQAVSGEIADKLIQDLRALSQEDRIDALEHLRDSLSYATPRETLGEYLLVADYVRDTWADQHHAFLYLAVEIKNIITSLLSGGEGFRVEGVYSNPSIPGSPRIVLLQLGKQLHGNLVQFFNATGENYWVLPFTEVVFDPKTALIELFNDGLTPESSYFFQGTVKEGRLQGRFATTSGEMRMLDLLRVEQFTVSNPHAQAIAVNDLLGSYLASSEKGVYRLNIVKFGDYYRAGLTIPLPSASPLASEKANSVSFLFRDIVINPQTNLIQMSREDYKGLGGDMDLRAFSTKDGLAVTLISGTKGELFSLNFVKSK